MSFVSRQEERLLNLRDSTENNRHESEKNIIGRREVLK